MDFDRGIPWVDVREFTGAINLTCPNCKLSSLSYVCNR